MVRVRFYNSIIESVQMKERVYARNDKLEIWIYIYTETISKIINVAQAHFIVLEYFVCF